MGDVLINLDDREMRPLDRPSQESSGSPPGALVVSRDESFALGNRSLTENVSPLFSTELVRFPLEGGSFISLTSHGTSVWAVALDPTETKVATGSADGTVRIGPISGEEPHVLLRHEGLVRAVQFSPDGRWLASAGEDRTIRLWPVPDLAKPPLHKRPLDELLATLRSCTNLRVAPDPKAPGRYELVRDPSPAGRRCRTADRTNGCEACSSDPTPKLTGRRLRFLQSAM